MRPRAGEKGLKRKVVYQGEILDLFVDQVLLPNQRKAIREVVGHQAAVAVVPILPDGQVILIQQYRYAVKRRLWEIPAGLIEKGESPRQAAMRELKEETGFRAGSWKTLGRIYSSPGFCEEKIHLFLARQLRFCGPPTPDADELINSHTVPLKKALALIRANKIKDGKTVIGLVLAAAKI